MSSGTARRLQPDVVPFSAMSEKCNQGLYDLLPLLAPGEEIFLQLDAGEKLPLTITLAQLGVQMTILTIIFAVILLSIAIASALALGTGSKAVVANIVAGAFIRDHFPEGREIQVQGVKGKLVAVNSVGTTVASENRIVTVLNSVLMENVVEWTQSIALAAEAERFTVLHPLMLGHRYKRKQNPSPIRSSCPLAHLMYGLFVAPK